MDEFLEMTEEYCNNEVPFDTTESGEKLYTGSDLRYAHLAGLKSGSQLDKVWHDYDAGEDCYEDTHEGKWVKRENNNPKWHLVVDGDLPKETEFIESDVLLLLVQLKGTKNKRYELGRYNFSRNIFSYPHLNVVEDVVAWCEIPKFENN